MRCTEADAGGHRHVVYQLAGGDQLRPAAAAAPAVSRKRPADDEPIDAPPAKARCTVTIYSGDNELGGGYEDDDDDGGDDDARRVVTGTVPLRIGDIDLGNVPCRLEYVPEEGEEEEEEEAAEENEDDDEDDDDDDDDDARRVVTGTMPMRIGDIDLGEVSFRLEYVPQEGEEEEEEEEEEAEENEDDDDDDDDDDNDDKEEWEARPSHSKDRAYVKGKNCHLQ